MVRKSFKRVALDIAYSQNHDMTSPQGLRPFLDCLTATRQGGMHWWGTKCSSFVSLCSSMLSALTGTITLETPAADLCQKETCRQKWRRLAFSCPSFAAVFLAWNNQSPAWWYSCRLCVMSSNMSTSCAKWFECAHLEGLAPNRYKSGTQLV